MTTALTPYELALVRDRQVLLTKNVIVEKVYEIFGRLAEDYGAQMAALSMQDLTAVPAKISRGENYRGLPYVVLDYPRIFGKENTCAIRSFFWWGNFFSITLQLSGEYLQRYQPVVQAAMDQEQLTGWSLSCGEAPWEHHFEKDNYYTIVAGQTYPLQRLAFLKIAKKIPLEEWEDAELFFKENFNVLLKLLNS